MYVDVPHLDCLLVAAPITLEGLDQLILKPKQLDPVGSIARSSNCRFFGTNKTTPIGPKTGARSMTSSRWRNRATVFP
jgi:hypothetical protein